MASEDTVSRAAHDRMTQERDALKAQVDELEIVVRDVAAEKRVTDLLQERGVSNPGRFATLAMPHVRDIEDPEALSAKIDDLFGDLMKTPDEVTPPPSAPATEEAPPPPNPFKPNPAAEGEQPDVEPIKAGSDEWKRVLKEEGLDGLRKLDKQGRVRWSEDTLKAQRLSRTDT